MFSQHGSIGTHPGRRGTALALALTLCAVAAAGAQRTDGPSSGVMPDTIAAVMIHPIVAVDVSCHEHLVDPSAPVILGDAAGTDCTVVRYDRKRERRDPPRFYANDGKKNEDWIGWREPLLAPFDAVVETVRVNPVTNEPGTPGKPPASAIVFRRADGTKVVYAHVQEVVVKEGDTVEVGQPVAKVGNDGFSYMPHTHIGAWRGNEPLQIRFDLKAAGALAMARRK